MSELCPDCGTPMRWGGICGNCNEVEANNWIMSQPEWREAKP